LSTNTITNNRTSPATPFAEYLRQAYSYLATAPGHIFTRAAGDAPLPIASAENNSDAPVRNNGIPTRSDMALISRFFTGTGVRADQLYCFECAPSTQRVDSYLTRMHLSSLNNYATDAQGGVAFMNSHRTGGGSSAELPLGRSFNGTVMPDPTMPDAMRFLASVYMLRSNNANGSVNTDDIIAGIEAGTVFDLSIGFRLQPGSPENNYADRSWLRCSICMQDYRCLDLVLESLSRLCAWTEL